jgi:hypothetical protein
MKNRIRDKILHCSIVNGYDGLEELIQMSQVNPADAASIAWDALVAKGDPGKDDYALCSELFQIIARSTRKSMVSSLVRNYWDKLDEERRLNLLVAIESGIVDIETIKMVFYSSYNTTRVRHRIVAALARRVGINKEMIRELVDNIGDYDSREQQEILNQFREDITNITNRGDFFRN